MLCIFTFFFSSLSQRLRFSVRVYGYARYAHVYAYVYVMYMYMYMYMCIDVRVICIYIPATAASFLVHLCHTSIRTHTQTRMHPSCRFSNHTAYTNNSIYYIFCMPSINNCADVQKILLLCGWWLGIRERAAPQAWPCHACFCGAIPRQRTSLPL
jgi:hypothetical protein